MSSSQRTATLPALDVTMLAIDERSRGLRRDNNGDGGRHSSSGDLSVDHPPRKGRRSRKGLEKKLKCDHPECGKSYSRAQHLYRHQLNHNPKDIYYCKFEGCSHSFVRQDLWQRHNRRHTRVPPLRRRSNSDNSFRADEQGMKNSPQSNTPGFDRPPVQQASMGESTYPSLSTASQPPLGISPVNSGVTVAQPYVGPRAAFVNPQAFAPLSLPRPEFATMSPADASRDSDETFLASQPGNLSSVQQHPGSSGPMMQLCASEASQANASRCSHGTFISWLLSGQQAGNPIAIDYRGSLGMSNPVDSLGSSLQPGYDANEFSMDGFFPPSMAQSQHPMAITSVLDSGESSLSDGKRQALIELIEMRFNENGHVAGVKAELMGGDRNDGNHILSLRSMQSYFWSYWSRFHPQLPILHQPTFVPDQQPDLLLIAMITVGTSFLRKGEAAKLANFLAQHLRGMIFNHAHSRPPAKLWVFQALLLLEIYEKRYSTHSLHGVAHVHHATTITLLRRGTALIERSATETPPSARDERFTHGSNSLAHTPSGLIPDKWWQDWITREATRRVAFAAFVVDSLHAMMFGHSAVMGINEIQLLLPCDEALWSTTSGSEMGTIAASLRSKGLKPLKFLDGLKATLKGQTVRTNSFGRTILMAGLVSVSWYMNQQDLLLHSVGVVQEGGRDRWEGTLMRAFDFWRADFAASVAENPESKNVLHHLAHMTTLVNIIDCQLFARAKRILGRDMGPQDHSCAEDRMKHWATTARARDAVFHALRLLYEELIPPVTHTRPSVEVYPCYSAREDYLMNRPWSLCLAALIVWSYGFATEGPIRPRKRPPSTPVEKEQDMYEFLNRAGSIGSPEELVSMQDKNRCLGTLMVLRDTFSMTRWELLQDACELLTNCIDMLEDSQPYHVDVRL